MSGTSGKTDKENQENPSDNQTPPDFLSIYAPDLLAITILPKLAV